MSAPHKETSMKSRTLTRAILGTSLALLSACSGSGEPIAATPAATFPVRVHARSEGQASLAGVELALGNQVLGKTDAEGTVSIRLQGNEGDSVALNVKCPAAYASPERPLQVGLRHLGNGSTAAQFDVDCFSLVHSVLVGIRAENGPHLPVLRLKSVVGQTDDQGVAHVLLQAAPNEPIALTLDTSRNAALLPQNPSLDFTAHDNDELVLVSQKFTLKRAPAPRVVPRSIPHHL